MVADRVAALASGVRVPPRVRSPPAVSGGGPPTTRRPPPPGNDSVTATYPVSDDH